MIYKTLTILNSTYILYKLANYVYQKIRMKQITKKLIAIDKELETLEANLRASIQEVN